MTDKLYESLSALMDDETDQLELRRLLKEMEESGVEAEKSDLSDLKAKWHRYHVISSACKQEIHSSPSCNLLGRIQAELENDAVPSAELPAQKSSLRKKGIFQILGQGAIAATVALAVLFTADLVMVSDSPSAAANNTELAGSQTQSNSLPELTGELNPSTQTRVAVQTALDADEMSRLERVVSEELDETLENLEIPAIFAPE
ncbi:sigma-E factor negative regulatory protein [Gammaproteobacteria bacterium]|nr:sigma-E factor negative regulatory protein [Gammaproteobacteria bacterium]